MVDGPWGPPPSGPPVRPASAGAAPPVDPSWSTPPAAGVAPTGMAPDQPPAGWDGPGRTGELFPTPPVPGHSIDRRPWWGIPDIVLGFLAFFIASSVAAVVVLLASGEGFDNGADNLPVAAVPISILAQQAVQIGWPTLVARWKGFGLIPDFRFLFKWRDLPLGIGAGFVALLISGIASATLAELIDVDPEEASNTGILTDAEGTIWQWLIIFAVVVGAPLAEEVFFRGLTLRAFDKRFGVVVALVASTVIFTVPHYSGGGWGGAAVTFTAIGIVGTILGVLAIQTNRLGSAIVAHMTFNGAVVISSLTIDESAAALVPLLS